MISHLEKTGMRYTRQYTLRSNALQECTPRHNPGKHTFVLREAVEPNRQRPGARQQGRRRLGRVGRGVQLPGHVYQCRQIHRSAHAQVRQRCQGLYGPRQATLRPTAGEHIRQ